MNRFPILIILTLFLLFSCRSTVQTIEERSLPVKQNDIVEDNRKEDSSAREERSGEKPLEDQSHEDQSRKDLSPAEQKVSEIKSIMDNMSDEEKVGQIFILAVRHTSYGKPAIKMDSYLKSLIERYKPGGIILFSINYETPDQTKALISAFQEESKLPLFICTDEEGGKVSRLGKKETMEVYPLPPAREIASMNDPSICEEAAYVLGLDLRELGFNVNMAPVADVSRAGAGGRVIGNRSFSSDPDTAGIMTAAAVEGFTKAGISSVIKHFPGHGNVSGDSHNGFVRSLSSSEEFRSIDFEPFRRGIKSGVPFLMMGHIAAPSLSGDNTPASLSARIQQEIVRKELGFDGLIITDAMDMGAIKNSYSSGEAAIRAFNAGTDIILMPENPQNAINAFLRALKEGRISRARLDASVERILELKIEKLMLQNRLEDEKISEFSGKETRHHKLNSLLIN